MMNALNGFSSAEDDLPARFFAEAASSTGALSREEFLATRAGYYRIRGLDPAACPPGKRPRSSGLCGRSKGGVEFAREIPGIGNGQCPSVARGSVKQLLDKYARKLVAAGLADEGAPLLGGLDVELLWNGPIAPAPSWRSSFRASPSTLSSSPAAEPYRALSTTLPSMRPGPFVRAIAETRTFMHEIPVIHAFEAEKMITALKKRKSVIIPGHGIVAWGTVSPEQAFVSFSSICFACFVKFFADYLTHLRAGRVSEEEQRVLRQAVARLAPCPRSRPPSCQGPLPRTLRFVRP